MAALVAQWQKPIDTLGKAGRAFDVSCFALLAAWLVPPACVGLLWGRAKGDGCDKSAATSNRPRSTLWYVLAYQIQGLESQLGGCRRASQCCGNCLSH